MLRTVVIGADAESTQRMDSLFLESGRFGLARSIDKYPTGTELERLLRAHAPQVVFLSASVLDEALATKKAIEALLTGLPVVSFGRNCEQRVLLELMKAGVREFLPEPIDAGELGELANRIEDHLAQNPLSFDTTDLLFSFLPSKPGVGASTLALNVSVALAEEANVEVLLADFDLNSGLIAFMLKLNSPFALMDAADKSEELDENLWPQLVSQRGKLHVLPSGTSMPGVRIEAAQIRRMLSFARRQYGGICVDLSGNLEKYSIELMQESKTIFLVTTPEIPPLHLARDRYNFLRQLDLSDRVCVLLNRWHKKSAVSAAQVEDLLEVPVYHTFPNNYNGVHQALLAGQPVAPDTDLGKQCRILAKKVLNPESDTSAIPKKKFLEHFSVLSSRYSVKT